MNRRREGINNRTFNDVSVNALVNVIFCFFELSNGHNSKDCTEWTKKLIFCGLDISPEIMNFLKDKPVHFICDKLNDLIFPANAVAFAELITLEVLIDYLPNLVSLSSIPYVGKCIDSLLLPILKLVLVKSPNSRQTLANSASICSTAVFEGILSRFNITTGLLIMPIFEELLRFDANRNEEDVIARVLSLPEQIVCVIKNVDWSSVADLAFESMEPRWTHKDSNPVTISFDPKLRLFQNSSLENGTIEWLNGQVVMVPAKKKKKKGDILGQIKVPSMGEYLRTAIVLLSKSSPNPILSYIAGKYYGLLFNCR